MNKWIFVFLIALLCLHCAQPRVMVVTGGHDFDHKPFTAMFNSMKINWQEIEQPRANDMIAADSTSQFDVLVFYDMYPDLTDAQKAGYLRLLQQGKGMVFLHHALVSYQEWPKFEKIIGGKYIQTAGPGETASTYQHDVTVNLHVLDKTHPVTAGLDDFELFDEVYGDFRVLPYITPLLTTDNPQSSPVIGWVHQYENSRIVFIQPGHGREAYENPNFRRLLYQAIKWAKQ